MIEKNVNSPARTATQLMFLVCGIGIASWAPMVPYAKERLQINDANLGLLLLLLGVGAITMMPVTGWLIRKYGSRYIILFAAILMSTILPTLLIIKSVTTMGFALFLFGACVGTIDVAMNAHAMNVQKLYGKHIMSSFHGLFSVGGLIGSLGIGLLVKTGLIPLHAAIAVSILILVIVFSRFSKLFTHQQEKEIINETEETPTEEAKPKFIWLKSNVLLLGSICCIVFLAEGAMIDWSALFLLEEKGVASEFTGMGYAAFSIAMAFMRLFGDHIVARFQAHKIVILGTLLGALGFSIAIFTPWTFSALIGFTLVGLGLANLVPIFFSDSGRLKGVPAHYAIPVITTMGYAGQLAGPALLGFIAYHFSLPVTFGFVASLLLLVCLLYKKR